MIKAYDIARYCIFYTNEQNSPLTNIDIQIILYELQKEFVENTGKPLFFDCITIKNGYPVVNDVYYKLCGYGCMPIAISNTQQEKLRSEIETKIQKISDTLVSKINRTIQNYINTEPWNRTKIFDYTGSPFKLFLTEPCDDMTVYFKKERM